MSDGHDADPVIAQYERLTPARIIEHKRKNIKNLPYLLHYHSPSVEQLSSEMFVVETLKVIQKSSHS